MVGMVSDNGEVDRHDFDYFHFDLTQILLRYPFEQSLRLVSLRVLLQCKGRRL